MKAKLHGQVQAELTDLVALGILSSKQARKLGESYPAGAWDLMSLARWFTILGAVAAGAGAMILAREQIGWQALADGGLALSTVAGLAGGRWLARAKDMPRSGGAAELLGAFSLQGLTALLAYQLMPPSGNWPRLIGLDAILTMALAYALGNRLVLVLALVNLFVWFGGSTGYDSHWGYFWLGMDYPSRFLLAGFAALGLAAAHLRWLPPGRQLFSRVWLHFGLLLINFSLWFFSLFGFYDGHVDWSGSKGQRVAFTAAWAALSVVSLGAAGRTGLGLVRGYAMTFLVINAYTLYFQFVVAESPGWWFFHLLLVGGSMLYGGVMLGRLRPKP